jgi:hypothetical protein
MDYIINDNKSKKVLSVRCIKNGSYNILDVEYNDNNKVEILKLVLDYISSLK